MIWVWTVVFAAALIIELATPSALISVWFALGALVSLLLALAAVSLWGQLAAFALVSLIALCVIRPLAARSLRGNVVATNADRLIGAMAVVEKRISAREWGSVRIEGNVWSAIAQDGRDIEPGTAVRVKAIEGVKLIVVPVNGPKGE